MPRQLPAVNTRWECVRCGLKVSDRIRKILDEGKRPHFGCDELIAKSVQES